MADVCHFDAAKNYLRWVQTSGGFAIGEAGVLAACAEIVISDYYVSALVAKIDYDGFAKAIDVPVVFGDACAPVYLSGDVGLHFLFPFRFRSAPLAPLADSIICPVIGQCQHFILGF